MNQILVRTNAGEYHSGDTVYGTVYLNIINPTAGCGVRLKFRGYEQFSYGLGDGGDTHFPLISDKKDYIDCSDIILYKSSAPISIGSYVFPFQFSLLHEIPGSFSAGGGVGVRWEAGVEYWVQAEMIGAETIKVIQPIVVLQKTCHTQQAEVVEHKIRGLLGLVTRNFSLTARILEQSHRVMGYANLRLIITNQSPVKVKSILVKLKRELLLCTKYSSATPLLDYPQIQRMDRKIWIQPEEEAIVWEHSISGDMGGVLDRGMDKLRVPLFTGRDQPIPPTTQGAHVQCRYKVEVTAVLGSGQSCSITVPIYSILPRQNQQWCSWERPDWVSNRLTVMTTLPPFSVQPHVLYGEAFAGLPPFQNL